MHQFVITKKDLGSFSDSVNAAMQAGYKLVIGSTYVKSLPTDVDSIHGQLLDDIEHVFSICLEKEGKHIFVSHHDLDTFISEVNSKLAKGYFVLTGSCYFAENKLDGFVASSERCFVTYHSCCLYKE